MSRAFLPYINSIFALLAVFVLHVSPSFGAQELQAEPAAMSEAGQDPAPQPAPKSQWHGGGTVGLTLQTGVSDQVGVSVEAGVFRLWPRWSTALEASYSYAHVKVGAVEQTVANSQNHRLLVRRTLTPRTFLLFRPSYKRNTVQQVDYRLEELAGVGIVLAHDHGLTLNAVPVIGAVQQRKHIPAVDGATGTGGFLESAQYSINRAWSLEQFFLYLRDFTSGDDHRLQFSVKLNGAIRGPVGLQLSYTVDRENVVLDASEKADQRIVASVSLRF